jgi:UDP:flavonoid glycosyltransferase YjiC (YdhE family)
MPIVLELRQRGHEVTVLCGPSTEPLFGTYGFPFRPALELERRISAFDPARYGGGRAAKLAWHAEYVQGLFADTARELEKGAFDAVMVDPLEPGAEFAVEAAGPLSFSYVHWRMDESGADVPFRFHFWDGEDDPVRAFVAWWNEQRALVGLAPERRPPAEHRWYRCSSWLTFVLGLPELVHPRGPLPAYARRAGPTRWLPPPAEPPPSWVGELGRERRAVLASVSTVGPSDKALLDAVAGAVDGEDLDVVLTAEGELPALPANVRVAPSLPHDAVLPRVSAVVSHAGNGTVTHAACAGVPLVLLPDGRDQFEVARGAVAAGVAIELRRDEVDATAMRDALRSVLDDPDYRQRAHEIAARAAEYDAPAVAADTFEEAMAALRH